MTHICGGSNSSITRVRPVFRELLRQDPTGRGWLRRLIDCAPNTASLQGLPTSESSILKKCTVSRPYEERVLTHYGIPRIDLPGCFEYDLEPPTAFLRWLVLNPHRMTWPQENGQPKTYGTKTQGYRERLVGKHGVDLQARVKEEAQHLIEKAGAAKSRKKWWAFEGFTSVDCWLETDNLILLIEGKRKEPLSKSTDWYPSRNQLIRNLEAVSEFAGGKAFGVLLIVELRSDIPQVSELLVSSLPHFGDGGRAALAMHYLGATTWLEVCDATGLDFSKLPDTTADVVEGMKRKGKIAEEAGGMSDAMYVARNRAYDFAQLTEVNLEFIEKSKAEGCDVHVVTQLANSLLGLVVFVWEKTFVEHMKELRMETLAAKGWPRVEVSKGTCETLYDFVRHLRNATAHGLITFSSDSPDPKLVTIQIEDCKPHEETPYWSARMVASELREFCLKFIALTESRLG